MGLLEGRESFFGVSKGKSHITKRKVGGRRDLQGVGTADKRRAKRGTY